MSLRGYGKITTKIKPLLEFHYAEEYHQDYLVKNPNGYCPDHSTGVVFKGHESSEEIDNSLLQKGKQIVVIESESCPYCVKLRENVLSGYQGTIPLSFRTASELKGLKVKTETWATPTVLFLENGKEVYGKKGYMEAETFYKILGLFKLGETEAFSVAFSQGTDARYCEQYQIFKNTPDGVFTDKLSGTALFDTKDRFNSGTGWLSFTKAIEGSVTEHLDTSFGMVRTELRSKSSGMHLGHVFPDGPNGKPRFCLNATVLDFKTREAYLTASSG
jgi:peptide methionine sulfoxide reductase msrA/msrB